MEYENLVLKESIMSRVRFIYRMKSVATPLVAKFAVFASLVAIAGFSVSLPNVLRNMPSLLDIGNFAHFFVAAFINTKFVVQAMSLGTCAVLFFMARDIFKVFTDSKVLKTA